MNKKPMGYQPGKPSVRKKLSLKTKNYGEQEFNLDIQTKSLKNQ